MAQSFTVGCIILKMYIYLFLEVGLILIGVHDRGLFGTSMSPWDHLGMSHVSM